MYEVYLNDHVWVEKEKKRIDVMEIRRKIFDILIAELYKNTDKNHAQK